MPAALDGVRVLEVGGGKTVAYAGKLLRDLGAEVIKVEPPEGDALREYGPFPGDHHDPEHSGLFVYMTAGKRGVRLDIERPAGRAALMPLIDGADVVLHSFRPSEARGLGLDYDSLSQDRPGLIVVATTIYGSTGPYAEWKGYPIHAYAGTGVSYRVGAPDREPLNAPLDGAVMHHAAPQTAAAIVLALCYRDRTGRGQFVDISAMEAVHVAIWGHTMQQTVYLGHPQLHRIGRMTNPVWGTRKTSDGDYIIMTQLNRHWQKFIEVMGNPEWARDPIIANLGTPAHLRSLTPEQAAFVQRNFREHLDPWMQSHTTLEFWAKMREARVSFHPVLTVPQVCESEQAAVRGFLVEVPDIEPPLRVPRAPYGMTGTPALIPGRPLRLDDPPATAWDTPRAEEPAPRDPAGVQPFAGVRVLDLTQVWAGPLMARYLADYGADVVHIRTASRPPTTAGSTDPENPMAWEWVFRNRRSLALDFTKPEAVDLFKRLASVADVVVDNFAPRVMPKFGLDYEMLCEANPRLIMVAMPPAGRDGPWSELVTYGPSLEALYGMKSLNGYPEDRELMESAAELDPTSAGYAAFAVFSALRSRERTGRGQFIEIAQGEAGLAGIAEAVIEYSWNQREMGPFGNTHRVLAPHGNYPAQGEDQWVAIACGSDEEWQALAKTAGNPEWLDDERFATAAGRREHRHEIDRAIADWTCQRDKWEVTRALQAAGVAAFPQLDQLEVVVDEQLHQRRQHFVLDPRFTGSDLLNGNPWHLSEAPPRLRHPAAELGTHNVEVLREYLGIPETEVRRLEESGVLA